MSISDIIKIKYTDEGYLKNYPPHLISDEEMCVAFINKASVHDNDFHYFYDTYPLLNKNSMYFESEDEYATFKQAYKDLISAFRYYCARFTSKVESWKLNLPDWVCSYMLGSVVCDSSDIKDRHYLLVGLNRDNMDDVMTKESEIACFRMSQLWVNKLNKSEVVISISKLLENYEQDDINIIQKELSDWLGSDYSDSFVIRPPAMYGEQNLIKLIRLSEAG